MIFTSSHTRQLQIITIVGSVATGGFLIVVACMDLANHQDKYGTVAPGVALGMGLYSLLSAAIYVWFCLILQQYRRFANVSGAPCVRT